MISVKVVTYQRPQKLLALLDSLKHQQPLDAPLQFSVEVIDNAVSPLSPEIVEKIVHGYGATYFHLGAENISVARNCAIDRCSTPYLAFIDDDEIASPHWLAHLKQTLDRYEADVVFGPTVPNLPAGKQWMAGCPPFALSNPETGSRADFFEATGNCMFRFEAISGSNLKFDERFGECGGEDSEYFAKLRRLGFNFVWSREAIAEETIDENRFSASWLRRRAFRCGGARGAVLSRWERIAYVKKTAVFVRLLPAEVINLAVGFARRKETPADFARANWMVPFILGYILFVFSGRVLIEYRGRLRFTKFTHDRRVKGLFWMLVSQLAFASVAARETRMRVSAWPSLA